MWAKPTLVRPTLENWVEISPANPFFKGTGPNPAQPFWFGPALVWPRNNGETLHYSLTE